jgi:7-cyano-7-deazaguanine synthase in queuosine biosynthesis
MHRLLLTATGNQLSGLSAQDLLWRPHGEPSSVETTLGPRLEGIGDVPPLYSDFVRLAATVFFVDRTVSRPRMLRRSLHVEVAVHDPALWDPHIARLGAVLGLLSGDEWMLSFRRRREPRQGTTKALDPADVSLLFSGGADSMCGALLARDEGLAPLLVSHFDWRNIGGQQTNTLDAYEQHLGHRPANIRWRFARRATQAGSGATFPNETSRRTRSLLFMAFGAAVSAVTQTDLWIAENGFTSLNPPLSPQSLGALSTRTTHPSFIAGLRETLADVGLDFPVVNRFADKTKGQVFIEATKSLDEPTASAVLSATHSCGKPQRLRGYAPDAQCGVCLGCLVRRGAFIAAGISDHTAYLEQTLSAPTRTHWLSDERLSAYRALQERLTAGFDDDDVLALGLPDDADLDGALQLIRDGLRELAAVHVS